MRWGIGIVGCLVFLAARATPADAQTGSTRTYSLAWVRGNGAEHCPPASELQRDVESRIGRPLFDGSASQSIEVSVYRDDRTTPPTQRSEIHVRDVDGKSLFDRVLSSDEADCRSLVASTALAIVLLVDPDAQSRSASALPRAASGTLIAPSTRAAPAAPSTSIPGQQFAGDLQRALRPSATEPALSVAPNQPKTNSEKLATPSSSSTVGRPATLSGTSEAAPMVRVSQLSLSAVVGMSLVPQPTFGALMAMRGWELPGIGWSLSALYLSSQASELHGATRLSVGVTALLPALAVELVKNDHVKMLVDLGMALGVLHLALQGAPANFGHLQYPLLAAHGEGRFQVKVSKNMYLELGGGALVPFLRHRFRDAANANELLFAQPAMGAIGRIGIGIQFP